MPLTLSRSLLVVLIPGVVASSPWLLMLLGVPEIKLLYATFELPVTFVMLAIVVIAGSVCEGLGTHLEARWDEVREKEYEIEENWQKYLARQFPNEPVGYRYMSRLATTLYFELSMMLAVPLFAIGAALHLGRTLTSCWPSLIVLIFGAVGVAYFYWQGSSSHRVLCKTRRELNRRLV
jgi:hypothetical protein